MYHYIFHFEESIKLVWRIGANLCSVCFLERNFIWIQDGCRPMFIFEVSQSMGELMDFVKV